jgi:membrane protease YdiL (CAAX protease family)
VWGLVQQFLIVALLAGNLRKHSRIPQRWIVLLTALVFALAHAASVPLAVAAFFLAAVTTTIYFRTRNMWALGLFHGLFATGLYFLALGQDLWTEVVSARQWP